jgi:membrane peptidoglycan carboxypeptidase
MLEMATVYGTLANNGRNIDLTPILEITDYTGHVIEKATAKTGTQAIKPGAAWIISNILSDNIARTAAFGPNSSLVIPNKTVSVKTGTTNDKRDNWTIGYTPSVVVTVWVGNNDNSPMNRSLVSGVTGAAPIWHDIMSFILKGKKEVWPEKPDDIISANICVTSGLLPNPESPCSTRSEFFWKGTEPTLVDSSVKDTWINPTTGLPPKEGDPTDGLQLQKRTLLTDPFTVDMCIDCAQTATDSASMYGRVIVPYTMMGGRTTTTSQ